MAAASIQYSGDPSEIAGRPGQVWGAMVIPAGGKTTMRINGDILQTTTRMNLGLENKEILTLIQKIDSIEVTEGRIWWLLIVGIALLFFVVGIIPIILFFVIKQKWIVVYSGSASLILFHKNTKNAREFADKLMAMARRLNSKAPITDSPQ